MRFDLRKIDDRINKLQEIRRIASDPEAATILFECIAVEDNRLDRPATIQLEGTGNIRHAADTNDLVADVLNGADPQAAMRRGRSLLG